MTTTTTTPTHASPLESAATRELVQRAHAGDQTVLPELRRLLANHPEIWQRCGELVTHAQNAWLKLIADDDLLVKESLQRRVAALKADLLVASATPLERLLVDRIGVCWLQVHSADLELAQAVRNGANQRVPTADVARKRLDSANHRYLAAMKQLALVRKLLKQSNQPDRPKPAVPLPVDGTLAN